jgi:UDP-GlcNAc:undecaprenyl-phosphate/decaprenyl-phosphate GlcNAc-1-phosphate transferase
VGDDDVSFLTAFVVVAVLTPVSAAVGVRAGLVDRPGALKIHARPTPVTGGLAVVIGVLAGALLTDGIDPWLVGAVVLVLVVGMLDDLRSLPPWTRLLAQAAAGGLLLAGGFEILPGPLGPPALILATIAACNAVNMLDGQDGLASGLAGVAALGLAAIAAGAGASLALALAGALGGFLLWNRPPARIFLGDGGAYALGVLLTASASSPAPSWRHATAALTCLGVFAFELVTTVLRRRRTDAGATRGDRLHTYDRLTVRTGSRWRSTLVLWAFGAVFALIGVAIDRASTVGVSLLVLLVLGTIWLEVRSLPMPATEGER